MSWGRRVTLVSVTEEIRVPQKRYKRRKKTDEFPRKIPITFSFHCIVIIIVSFLHVPSEKGWLGEAGCTTSMFAGKNNENEHEVFEES